MNIDLYILAFSAVTVLATIWMGFRSAKKSKTASDFFVAGRSVGVGMNASAISGEYLSAASFMGIAGMVMSSGYDALWYPVCYACGYLFLLLFIAGPLRRFGAYTIPDFAEGRFDSPVFRKIAVVFVLFIGFFYTMPQMKGAGTTLAYIFPGLPYWAGVVLVGAVITLNVALGGMKGITLVQAFQYWAKMFAISVPIFVLMAVYGHYGKQVALNTPPDAYRAIGTNKAEGVLSIVEYRDETGATRRYGTTADGRNVPLEAVPRDRKLLPPKAPADATWLNPFGPLTTKAAKNAAAAIGKKAAASARLAPTPEVDYVMVYEKTNSPPPFWKPIARDVLGHKTAARVGIEVLDSVQMNPGRYNRQPVFGILHFYGVISHKTVYCDELMIHSMVAFPTNRLAGEQFLRTARAVLETNFLIVASETESEIHFAATNYNGFIDAQVASAAETLRRSGHPPPMARLQSFRGPIADTMARTPNRKAPRKDSIPLRAGLSPEQRMTVNLDSPTVAQALAVYAELTGRQLLPKTNSVAERMDDLLGGMLSQLKFIARAPTPDRGVREHNDGALTAAEVKEAIEAQLRTNRLLLVAVGANGFALQRAPGVPPGSGSEASSGTTIGNTGTRRDAGGTLAANAEKAWLAKHEKPLALLYTYSLIIAIVCGTAGLPHILVRFYTNPDGTAAKKTTMWVMILIGVFYVFPPVFGVLGRNLMPDLYTGLAGIKGTDQVVLKLPVLLNEKYPPLGSILSGITCAGAFAAFMSTFSGLLVSMTGALAHDVYGRILRPKSTPEQRMRMFKIGAVLIGGIAVLLGSFVEPLEINFMVGQAFAIAAASYFPLLFMAVWWRKLTMKGAAVGMLTGGVCALVAAALTNFSNLASDKGPMGKLFAGFAPLNDFWAAHPLLRILCEQPAIWAVPLALALMIIVSKLTAKTVPSDSRMKMLVLHAPEQLGLKQEYIQEHNASSGH